MIANYQPLMRRIVAAVILSVCATQVIANSAGVDPVQIDEFSETMAREHHFDRLAINNVLRLAVRLDSVLAAISKPAEHMPWHQYRKIFLTPARIEAGGKFWRTHAAALSAAEAQFGVPPEYIVAIIGVETFYGRNVGNYRVLDALATLAFHFPKRAAFFREELVNYLLLAREEEIDPIRPRGSYAGAMGIPQFMPSSFRHYAVDFDHDNHRDVWQDPADAIGSVGNYLARHGWRAAQAVALPGAESVVNAAHASESVALNTTVAELVAAGIQAPGATDPTARAVLLRFEGTAGDEYWLGLNNFYVITRYNRSPKYARAVTELASALRAANPQVTP